MSRLVMFGTGPIAKMAHFLFTHDSPHEVVAFAVDRDHLGESEWLGLPVVPFDEVESRYPPDSHGMFIAVGYRRVNRFRAERYAEARAMGYELATYISPRASIWPDVTIGDNCLVMDLVILNPFVTIGSDTILWSGSHVGHDSTVGDHCFIASHAIVSGLVTIGSNCFLGSNSTVRDTITIGSECVIGAGAVVTHDAPPGSVFAAAPAVRLPISSDRLPHL